MLFVILEKIDRNKDESVTKWLNPIRSRPRSVLRSVNRLVSQVLGTVNRPQFLSFDLNYRNNQYEQSHDNPVTSVSFRSRLEVRFTHAASTPNTCMAPCLDAHGTWKKATLNPPRVRARLISADISPWSYVQ